MSLHHPVNRNGDSLEVGGVVGGSSVYKPSTAFEQNARVVCNEDKFMELYVAHYAAVNTSNIYRDFCRRKDEAEQNDLNFRNAENRSYSIVVSFLHREGLRYTKEAYTYCTALEILE